MGFNESDTRAKLIDPALHSRGWTEDLIRREETAGTIQVIDGKPRKSARGRVDYALRIKVTSDSQPVAVAIIEAKAEDLPPTHGLEQAKAYAACKRLNVPFVFASNGHLFVEFDRASGLTSAPCPLREFPTPEDLRNRYEGQMGFRLADTAARPLLVRYTGGEATRRYYQDAAIRAVLEKIAQCDKAEIPKRALLSLATGAERRLSPSICSSASPTPDNSAAPCSCVTEMNCAVREPGRFKRLRRERGNRVFRQPAKECAHPHRHLPNARC